MTKRAHKTNVTNRINRLDRYQISAWKGGKISRCPVVGVETKSSPSGNEVEIVHDLL